MGLAVLEAAEDQRGRKYGRVSTVCFINSLRQRGGTDQNEYRRPEIMPPSSPERRSMHSCPKGLLCPRMAEVPGSG